MPDSFPKTKVFFIMLVYLLKSSNCKTIYFSENIHKFSNFVWFMSNFYIYCVSLERWIYVLISFFIYYAMGSLIFTKLEFQINQFFFRNVTNESVPFSIVHPVCNYLRVHVYIYLNPQLYTSTYSIKTYKYVL